MAVYIAENAYFDAMKMNRILLADLELLNLASSIFR